MSDSQPLYFQTRALSEAFRARFTGSQSERHEREEEEEEALPMQRRKKSEAWQQFQISQRAKASPEHS